MEKCRNLTPCTLELLDDPALKTTAANYDFKVNGLDMDSLSFSSF